MARDPCVVAEGVVALCCQYAAEGLEAGMQALVGGRA